MLMTDSQWQGIRQIERIAHELNRVERFKTGALREVQHRSKCKRQPVLLPARDKESGKGKLRLKPEKIKKHSIYNPGSRCGVKSGCADPQIRCLMQHAG